jgi:Acetyltransferase (GNAT) domain
MSLTADAFAAGTADADATAPAIAARAVSIRRISGDEWDRTIAEFDEASQEQLFAFATNRWPSVGHEPLLLSAGGEVVGGCLVMIQKLPLGLGGIAIAKWGPMLRRTDRPDADALYAGMIEALIAEYAVRRRLMISIWPNSDLAGPNKQYRHLLARGFRPGAKLLFPNRYIVNLGLNEAAQRKSLHQKWRYHLNKADKAGLSFEHGGPERLPEFDALYRIMTDRKKFADHSAYQTVPALMALPEAARPELFFVRHEGEAVAGAIIFKAGDRAVYLYGATNDRALPLRAGYFMHWHIIGWLREHTHARWYDLGGTDGFQGLHQFKKGMVGDAGVITPVPPVANYAAYRLPMLLGTSAFAARELFNQVRRTIENLGSSKAKPDQAKHEDKAGEAE